MPHLRMPATAWIERKPVPHSTSDCAGFANGCVQGENHYSGTAEGGSCSKVL